MLSIIIPTLNEERYLPRLLNSIKHQDFKEYEIIVADNNSKDKTKKIVKKYKCKVVHGNKKPGIGRNNGAKIAKGNLLLFLDADCILNKNLLSNALKDIKNKNIGVACCYIYPYDGSIIDKIYFSIFNIWIMLTQTFFPNSPGCCIFVKKEIHNKIKGFDERIFLYEEDDYVKRASKLGKFKILDYSIQTSARRFIKEGRIKVGLKLLISTIYRISFGEIKSDIFKYRFGHKKWRLAFLKNFRRKITLKNLFENAKLCLEQQIL